LNGYQRVMDACEAVDAPATLPGSG